MNKSSIICLLSSRQHAGLWDGWPTVPAVLHRRDQVLPARASSHGDDHQVPHHGFPWWTTFPPPCSLLQPHHRRSIYVYLCLYHGNNIRIFIRINIFKGFQFGWCTDKIQSSLISVLNLLSKSVISSHFILPEEIF